MTIQDLLQRLPDQARFADHKAVKIDCFRSERLLVGLNCFEPGQGQAVHTHAGADKFYFVVSGKARFVLGTEHLDAGPGDLVVAPKDLPHGVDTALERTVLLVGIAPAPAARHE